MKKIILVLALTMAIGIPVVSSAHDPMVNKHRCEHRVREHGHWVTYWDRGCKLRHHKRHHHNYAPAPRGHHVPQVHDNAPPPRGSVTPPPARGDVTPPLPKGQM